MKKEDYNKAIEYFQKATDLENSNAMTNPRAHEKNDF